MDKAEENIRIKPSGWYYADLAVAAVTVLGLGFTGINMVYHVIFYVPVIAFILFNIVFSCKEHYTHKPSKPWRIASGVIRGVLYAIALFSFAVPVIMEKSEPDLYPLQKTIFSFNYTDRGKSTLYFLPDKIPRNARDYKIEMFPGLLQEKDRIRIEFFTTSEWLAVYRSHAQSCGAVKSTERYENKKTGMEESAEVWKFRIYEERYAVYYICPESGYFMILR